MYLHTPVIVLNLCLRKAQRDVLMRIVCSSLQPLNDRLLRGAGGTRRRHPRRRRQTRQLLQAAVVVVIDVVVGSERQQVTWSHSQRARRRCRQER